MGESHPRCEDFLTNILAQAGEGGREGRAAGKAKTAAAAATSFGYLAKWTTTVAAAAERREERRMGFVLLAIHVGRVSPPFRRITLILTMNLQGSALFSARANFHETGSTSAPHSEGNTVQTAQREEGSARREGGKGSGGEGR